jgi:hypothetical protein
MQTNLAISTYVCFCIYVSLFFVIITGRALFYKGDLSIYHHRCCSATALLIKPNIKNTCECHFLVNLLEPPVVPGNTEPLLQVLVVKVTHPGLEQKNRL